MKVLTCTTPGTFEYGQTKRPTSKEGHSILKILKVGICGTDLHAYEGTQPYFDYPRVLGHEIAAEVVETSDAPEFNIGEHVTIVPYFYCGTCIACRRGKTNCCTTIQVSGVHIDGAMCEYLSVPSYSLVHGEGLKDDILALIEPLAVGCHAVQRAGVKAGEFTLVVGAGPIGLGLMEFARIAGGKVIALDVDEGRLSFCSKHLKSVITLDARRPDLIDRLKEITKGDMLDVVFDATGNQKAINNSFRYIAHGGRYILVGLQKGDITFSHPEFHKREATLMSSRNATRDDFVNVISCIKRKEIEPENFITHRVTFDDLKDSFGGWLHPSAGVIKAMVSL